LIVGATFTYKKLQVACAGAFQHAIFHGAQSREYTRGSKVIPTDFAVLVAIELEEHNIEVLL
jgi:hypothetical protein